MTKLGFGPATNGFAFPNAFTFSPSDRAQLATATAPAIDGALGALGPLGLGARLINARTRLAQVALAAVPDNYGLCGGMAFAALDYFRAGRVASWTRTEVPPAGSALHLYLWQRLLDSWQLNGVTFLEWKARLHLLPQRWPFDAGPKALRDRSRTNWRLLQQRLDAGSPVVIGLVSDSSDPFHDHQVLGYGYDDGGEWSGRIYVYDSNCPEIEQTIDVDLTGELLVATESCQRALPTRGFFCEAYASRVPPPDL